MSDARPTTVRITEIYASVQGESTHVGRPCTFVRLTGCPLRCTWCDSEYTFKGGERWSIDDILAEVSRLGVPLVEVTGGEPLAQKAALELLARLVDEGFEVLLETAGSLSIRDVPSAVKVIMDLKAPDSSEEASNLWCNLPLLKPIDEVKIVLASRRDYDWAVGILNKHQLHTRCAVLLSPAWGLLEPSELVQWMLADRVQARLQLQMHKVIWPAAEKGV